MTKEELKAEITQIDKDAEDRKQRAYREYALSNNQHKIGDIITNHIGSIIIESIRWHGPSFCNQFPECIYSGIALKKDGTPKKNNIRDAVYQSDIKEK